MGVKVEITSGGVDGLIVTFPEGHYFDTWEEAFEFIIKVEELAHNCGHYWSKLTKVKKE